MIVTIFIADSLRYIADGRTACTRIQNLIEKQSMLTRNMDYQHKPFSPEVSFKGKGKGYEPGSPTIESFRNAKPHPKREQTSQEVKPSIFLKDVSCFWNQTTELPALQSVSLSAANGQLVGITGPVGSGKTSLLMTILGELPISSGAISCIGKIALVSQTPWVYSGTLRENIVFGSKFDVQKYNKVIEVCDLEKDISSFTKRDLTEIGQRGVILSGGQRARVSLARAIYSDADIYLLDDPLSAVDAKVGKHLFDRCIKEFLHGRMRILVTHQLQFLKETDSIVIIRSGSVVSHEPSSRIEQYMQTTSCLLPQQKQDFDGEDTNREDVSVFSEETSESTNSAIEHRDRVDLRDEEEDRIVGTVKWWVYWKYLRAALPTILIISLIIFFAIVQGR